MIGFGLIQTKKLTVVSRGCNFEHRFRHDAHETKLEKDRKNLRSDYLTTKQPQAISFTHTTTKQNILRESNEEEEEEPNKQKNKQKELGKLREDGTPCIIKACFKGI